MDIDITDDTDLSTENQTKKSEKHIKTKLIVKSGDTVVIGGVYKENRRKDLTGVPWLKDIPFLGWLFKAERKTIGKSELLIFITPTVLTEG